MVNSCCLPLLAGQSVGWRGEDEAAVAVLAGMAAFCGIAMQEAVPGHNLKLHALPSADFLRLEDDPEIWSSGFVAARWQGNQVEAFVEDRSEDYRAPVHAFARYRQIFHLGLLSQLTASGLLLHGALAEFAGCGVIITGPSGMGKSTTVSRLPAPWQIHGDDAVWLECRENRFYAVALPTWSCGWNAAPHRFRPDTPAVPLSLLIGLQRGATNTIQAVHGATRCGIVNRAAMDLLNSIIPGMARERQHALRRTIFNRLEALLEPIRFYSLNLNLRDPFASLLEGLL